MSWNDKHNTTDTVPIAEKVSTWELTFYNLDKAIKESGADNNAYLAFGDVNRMRQYSICGLLQDGVGYYWEAYGEVPGSMEELAASGFGPLAPGTINPLTGQPYVGNGAPNDIYFSCQKLDDIENAGGSFSTDIYPVGNNGERLWFGSYL
jgi:hypothetical protein